MNTLKFWKISFSELFVPHLIKSYLNILYGIYLFLLSNSCYDILSSIGTCKIPKKYLSTHARLPFACYFDASWRRIHNQKGGGSQFQSILFHEIFSWSEIRLSYDWLNIYLNALYKVLLIWYNKIIFCTCRDHVQQTY